MQGEFRLIISHIVVQVRPCNHLADLEKRHWTPRADVVMPVCIVEHCRIVERTQYAGFVLEPSSLVPITQKPPYPVAGLMS